MDEENKQWAYQNRVENYLKNHNISLVMDEENMYGIAGISISRDVWKVYLMASDIWCKAVREVQMRNDEMEMYR